MISRGFPNVVTSQLRATTEWYVQLLGWGTEFESDWFVHLKSPEAPAVELGIIDAEHEIVAGVVEPTGAGALLTFVVEDVDAMYQRAVDLGLDIVEEPRDLFYGQRRMIVRDPNGTAVDVSSECAPSQEFLDSLPHQSEH